MSAGSDYAEVAGAAGAWTCPIVLPSASFARVRAEVTAFVLATRRPLDAFAFAGGEGGGGSGGGDAGVAELLAYRDPSRVFGAPPTAACATAVRALAAATGWRPTPQRAPVGGVLVGLGMREGYVRGAPGQDPREVARALGAHRGCWSARVARIVSARRIGDSVRWYDEAGVVVHARTGMLPLVAAAARACGQHRFVVTDLGLGRTYALARGPARG
ncbi:hypothetical protein [Streptodolium elevatio]|uniref:Uncharacterized protein n=1 Tax=Streptodolium elevatio TaxID=3157996 RepID=A0ABV3D992_9ACTN